MLIKIHNDLQLTLLSIAHIFSPIVVPNPLARSLPSRAVALRFDLHPHGVRTHVFIFILTGHCKRDITPLHRSSRVVFFAVSRRSVFIWFLSFCPPASWALIVTAPYQMWNLLPVLFYTNMYYEIHLTSITSVDTISFCILACPRKVTDVDERNVWQTCVCDVRNFIFYRKFYTFMD